eukprot:COSAG05_NODE_624_length_8276_cov_4.903265_3_plen_68_part_00
MGGSERVVACVARVEPGSLAASGGAGQRLRAGMLLHTVQGQWVQDRPYALQSYSRTYARANLSKKSS